MWSKLLKRFRLLFGRPIEVRDVEGEVFYLGVSAMYSDFRTQHDSSIPYFSLPRREVRRGVMDKSRILQGYADGHLQSWAIKIGLGYMQIGCRIFDEKEAEKIRKWAS